MKGTKPQLVVDNSALKFIPPAPEWLAHEAKKEWDRIMPGLIDRGILTEGDIASLENYVIAQGRVRETERDLQATNDPEIKTKLFRMQDKAMQTARQYAAELGLTPISRSRPATREMFPDEDGDPLGIR